MLDCSFTRIVSSVAALFLAGFLPLPWRPRVPPQCGELHRLQCLLHSIPELHDDEESLEEVERVFKMSKRGQDGTMNGEQLTALLSNLGVYSVAETREIYQRIKRPHEGVGLKEFEDWWLAAKRLEVRSALLPLPPAPLTEQ